MKHKNVIAIDASDANSSGMFVWLEHLLTHIHDLLDECDTMFVLASPATLLRLPKLSKIKYLTHPLLGGGVIRKQIWKRFFLDQQLAKLHCTVLLCPNGDYRGNFQNYVVMNHNMALVDRSEMMRFFPTLNFVRLKYLARQQKKSFRNASSVIALSEYAKHRIEKEYSVKNTLIDVVENGLDEIFDCSKKNKIARRTTVIIYVSTINAFKHHCNVLEAAYELKRIGEDIELWIFGDVHGPTYRQFCKRKSKLDPACDYLKYFGLVGREELLLSIDKADIGIFASTCEAFPFTLLEKMGRGLPTACSSYSSMPSIAKDGVIYFDPLVVDDIVRVLKSLIRNGDLRQHLSKKAKEVASEYTGVKMAGETLKILKKPVSQSK